MELWLRILAILIICILFYTTLCLANPATRENLRKRKRLKENQDAWDEYSANLTYPERMAVYNDWCRERKLVTGNHFYWFPNMYNTPPKYLECRVNGTHHRGTLEEVARYTNLPLEFLKQFETCVYVVDIRV